MKGRVGRRCAGLLLLDRAPDHVRAGSRGATSAPRWWALREVDGEVLVVDDAELLAPEREPRQEVLW